MSNKLLTAEETNRLLKRKETNAKWQKISAWIFIGVMLLIMYLPIIYLVVYSFTDSKIIGQWTNTTFDLYRRLFSPDYPDAVKIWSATWNTIWVAVVASLLSTILGTLGAIGMHYLGKKLQTAFNIGTQIPIVNAEIVMALSLCILFISMGLRTNVVSLIIGHMVITIPFVVINVQPKLEQMDPSLYEAAMDLGANRTEAMTKVIIPDIIPGILSGFMISMTLSLDDYVITEFTKPNDGDDFQTLSTYVQSTLSKGNPPIELRSFTTILFGIIIAVMVAFTIITIKKGKAKRA